VYRRTFPRVYAYVAGLLRDRAAAEDVTAQAFERAYRKRRSFRAPAADHALEEHADLALRRDAVARVLGISESNAGTRLHRAVEKLRKACHDDA
jgi:DNA-directed RNA polymerase specialized sigma24 family protein